jgi:signal transduction histidine kinase
MKKLEAKPKVLIIDDDPIARETLAERLGVDNLSCLFAADAFEALEQLEEIVPDLILLDVMLPQMDGLQLCRRIKSNQHWQHVPIILVTALDSKKDMIAGLDAGADEFLSKPVDGAELRARIRSMLRIKRQYDDLQATLQLREDLVNMLVHDLRSPLGVMMLHNGAMLHNVEQLSQEWLDSAKIIHAQLHRLDSFINDMLIVAKMENGRLSLHCTLADVNQLVEQIKSSYQARADILGIQINVNLAATKSLVYLDVNLFKRVLDNLLSNALKFSPEGGIITVQVMDQSETVTHIQVFDQGPGIPVEQHERIFDKFEIIELRRKGISQIGLGLAFCKMVVEAHGGQISVADNTPQGAVFTIEMKNSVAV